MSKKIVIVGGSAAGMAAAGRSKRLSPDLDIHILETSKFISYNICSLPYYVSGEIPSQQSLIKHTPESLKQKYGIHAHTGCRALKILPWKRQLLYKDTDNRTQSSLDYDKLVLATGYKPHLPHLGKKVKGLFTVSRLEDGIGLVEALEASSTVVVVGAGYVGLMIAEALKKRGLSVTLLEQGDQVYPLVDVDMAQLIQTELEYNGIFIRLKHKVTNLETIGGKLKAFRVGRHYFDCDLGLVDIGVVPNIQLADESGIGLGISGGIAVNSQGKTNSPDIFAAGNCAETIHLVTGEPIVSTLATTAAKQGRVVGENLAGRRSEFDGTLETSIEKVFNLGVSRTGLTLHQALKHGYKATATKISTRDNSAPSPVSDRIHVKLVYTMSSGRLLGGQIIGPGDAAKRIDTLSVALTAGLNVRQLSQLDLAYAPPFSTLLDPIQIAANVALRKLRDD